ncbi:MAG: hypothetical protein ACAI44_38595 [Candidatus Sericytochromatia bacterium]
MNVPASSTLLLSAPGALFQGFFFSRLPAPGAQTQIPASPTMSLSSLNLTVARDPGRSLPVLNLVSSHFSAGSVTASVAPLKTHAPAQVPARTLAAPLPVSATTLPLPTRPANAPSGSAFLNQIQGLNRAQREEAFLKQILSGNVPDHLRHFKEIEVSAKGGDGQMHTATVRVLPDYLAIGSNQDYTLVPMSPLTAQKIADALKTDTQPAPLLPTRKLVNEIYKAAEVKLQPSPKTPGPQMMSTPYYAAHDAKIRQQRQQAGASDGNLISGHKKDMVLSNLLDQKPQRVAIYGWHQLNGKAIQPLSTVHEDTYADYSHGARLIGGTVRVDGVERPTAEVLHDANLASLLSDEGPIRNTRIKLR